MSETVVGIVKGLIIALVIFEGFAYLGEKEDLKRIGYALQMIFWFLVYRSIS